MNSANQPESGPDAISTIATFGVPLFVGALLAYRIANGHWESVAFMGLIFLVVMAIYVRLFWHDDSDCPDLPPDDAELTSNEMDTSS